MVNNIEIEQLKTEHAKLHVAVEKIIEADDGDDIRLSVMKKRKLWLKDKISQLEQELEIA